MMLRVNTMLSKMLSSHFGLVCAIFGIALFSVRLPCAQESERSSGEYYGADSDFFKGKDLYLRSQTTPARSHLEKYLKDNPQGRFMLEARFLLAVTETDIERAKDGFWQLYRDRPEDVLGRLAYFQYGCLLLLSGQYADTSEVFEHLTLAGVGSDDGLVQRRDFLPLNVMDLADFGVDGLYAASLVLAESLPAAENAVQQFASKTSSPTASERWLLLSGVLADKQGRFSECQNLLSRLVATSPNSSACAAACYYALAVMRSGTGAQDGRIFADHLAKAFSRSPEYRIFQRSRQAE